MSSVLIGKDSVKYRDFDGKVYFTYKDIQKLPEWPEGPLLQIIEGELYMTPSPTLYHQEISGRIEFMLRTHNQYMNYGWIYSAPTDVILDDENLVIPDLIFISNNRSNIRTEKNIQGTPELIIEILSTNRHNDLVIKKKIYEKFKVEEYIIIDPLEKQVIQYIYKNGKFNKEIKLNENDILKLNSLKLDILIQDIF